MTVLVTGGAGYIGAHVVRELHRRGEAVLVVDDLSSGYAERLAGVVVERLDVASEGAAETLAEMLRAHAVDAAVHFAARKEVPESVQRPAWYFQQNVGGLANVLQAMITASIGRLVYSSSAAVYGHVTQASVTEDHVLEPINPYGETKLVGEWLVADVVRAAGIDAASLRYFNVAGAGSPELADRVAKNLIPMVFERLDAQLPPVIFGDDYATEDGTCIRDFIHVQDLAMAHVAVLDALRDGRLRGHTVLNVGTGVGYSVRQVMDVIRSITGHESEPVVQPRRQGDPERVVADPTRIRDLVGWEAERGLDAIVESAWRGWEHVRAR
jgi:UDP-glucose 4-epimerase